MSLGVLALFIVGCGGDAGKAAVGTTGDGQPPANVDQPPASGTDQVSSNSDPAASSNDAPPSSPDAPAGTGSGGRLGALCQQVCATVSKFANNCNFGMSDVGMGDNPCS